MGLGSEWEVLTAVNNSVRMKVLDCGSDRLNQLRSVVLVKVLLGADPVKQFSTLAQIGNQVHCDQPIVDSVSNQGGTQC